MANVINATSTGNGGLVSTGDDSGILNIQTNETTAITVDASQNTTFAGKVTSAGALTLASNGTTTAVTIDTSQNVLIATTNAITGITGVQLTASNTSENPAYINIFRDDTTIGNGQFLGYLQFCGRDATSSLGTAHAYVGAVAEADHGAGDNATAITFGTTPDNSSSMAERMRIDSSGNLLVGTTSATSNSRFFAKGASVSSSDIVGTFQNSNSSELFSVYADGQIRAQFIGSTTGTSLILDSSGYIKKLTSSIRYKKDVEPIDIGLNFILGLNPVKYKLKESDEPQVGFIAEDFPDARLVSMSRIDKEDESKGLQAESVNYSQIVAPLVKAIKELKAINDTQAETINALTARIVALESRGTV
jgi:hypothetical protein